MFITLLLVMICVMILNQDYSKIFAAGNIKNESGSEKMQIDYSLIPTNISVLPESLPGGNLYLSSILSNGTITYTRSLTDEVCPFQMDRWYQQIKFVPNYQDRIQHSNVTIERLLIGQMSDFDNFDELLNHSRIYEDVPFNSTIVLDLPNRDVSFMETEVKFPHDDVGIYRGLYDGNQQTDTSFIFAGSCSISSLLIKYIDPFTTSATAAALGGWEWYFFTPFVCLRIID